MGAIEIERKWLMESFPNLQEYREEVMEQGYISFTPAVRIRKVAYAGREEYLLTIKGEGTLSRVEVETPLTKEQYTVLLPMLKAPLATKKLRRYAISDGLELECSLVDEGAPTSFYYAEIEFESEQQAKAFTPPSWFGREVTEEKGYTMAEYCIYKAKNRTDSKNQRHGNGK